MKLLRNLLLFCCLALTACVHDTGIRHEFEKSTKEYNRMLRWQEISRAAATYSEPEYRDEFISAAATIRTRGVTITDYRILTTECLPDKETGEVVAEFDYYILPSNRIKSLTYSQDWVYRSTTGTKKAWKVKSALPAFE
ncbi:MAG: hypothetical protein A2X80_14480 [Geobacteraceae bacterium GWB2_52_12]|nr:MAG: hypothetical protein A2X80_14480 [Geobacteraceae bacterium GWB2_52_12]